MLLLSRYRYVGVYDLAVVVLVVVVGRYALRWYYFVAAVGVVVVGVVTTGGWVLSQPDCGGNVRAHQGRGGPGGGAARVGLLQGVTNLLV